ncbi:hypothetical protein [Arthrobacter sp. B3I4]|uniref:hypothetical protein n=1 Tax=Arthrobacter sp. B3I4 TaxID=3042267 RepID=UPI0027D79CFF|nr:hypothetical protein [Arthrobacter sp. B3I4]
MPTLSLSGPLGAWQLLALALFVAAAVAGSVYLVRKHQASDGGLPDAVFWDGFGGLAVVAPAILLPALVSPWAGLLLAAVGVTAAGASYRWTPVLFRRQESRRAARETAAADAAAILRHRTALDRWQRYELDPAFCIDFPAMSDPRRPETAALIKAMKAAELSRHGSDRNGDGYSAAVDRLEQALAAAERAAGAEHTADAVKVSP